MRLSLRSARDSTAAAPLPRGRTHSQSVPEAWACGDNEGVINLGVLIQQAARPGASKEDLRRAYLARILTQADQLPLFASDGSQAQIRLSSITAN
jgi:hypothetical protein